MHTILFSVGDDSSEMIHMMRMMLPLIQADPLHQEVFESRLAQKKNPNKIKSYVICAINTARSLHMLPYSVMLPMCLKTFFRKRKKIGDTLKKSAGNAGKHLVSPLPRAHGT